MRGCWKRSVCMGTGAFTMFEERIIQWWCTDEQLEANKDMAVPFSGLVPLEEKAYTGEWERACAQDSDCPHPERGQVCTDVYWDAIQDGSSFAKGDACYNWETPVCPGEPFGQINYNYDNTGWSYYIQQSCKEGSGESGANMLATAASAALIAALALF